MDLNKVDNDVAQAFVDARRTASALPDYPGTRPLNLAAAYAIQDRAIAIAGRTIAGWKVGRINAPDDTRLGSDRLAGPIYADSVIDLQQADGAQIPAMPVFADGFAAAEAEFMLRLKIPATAPLPGNDADTLEWIDDVRIGIEIASSPYPRINDDGPCVTVSDHGNNAGLVLGASIADWRTRDLNSIQVETEIDGQVVGSANTATMLDGPLGAVRFLLRNLIERGISPQSGWWVSSGAVTGVHPAAPGQRVIARFADIGELSCTIAVAGSED
ncbi:MAG: 2-keto-4-pentenoate hydratase [Sphingomonas sp.]|nr:2-keto-4-pentenoate hydratase [Sphingomonas sp.]